MHPSPRIHHNDTKSYSATYWASSLPKPKHNGVAQPLPRIPDALNVLLLPDPTHNGVAPPKHQIPDALNLFPPLTLNEAEISLSPRPMYGTQQYLRAMDGFQQHSGPMYGIQQHLRAMYGIQQHARESGKSLATMYIATLKEVGVESYIHTGISSVLVLRLEAEGGTTH